MRERKLGVRSVLALVAVFLGSAWLLFGGFVAFLCGSGDWSVFAHDSSFEIYLKIIGPFAGALLVGLVLYLSDRRRSRP